MGNQPWKQRIHCTVSVLVGIGIGAALIAWLDPGENGWGPTNQFLAGFIAVSLLVLAGLPLMAHCVSGDKKEPRGLGLPRGSIRGMLALWMVGSYLLFLVFAPTLATTEQFSEDVVESVMTAFGPLVGAVLAFYFAGRTATPSPKKSLADLTQEERAELKKEIELGQ